MIIPQATYHPHPDVLIQLLDGETVLLHLKTEEYYTLDHTSTRMWQLLIEHGEVEPVIVQMLNEFEVDEDILRRDLTTLITDCIDTGLLIESR